MPSLVDVAIGLFLAYYWTGYDMVLFHSQLESVDRPSYVDGPKWKVVISGAGWPLIAYLNRELSWFGVCFLSSAIVFTAVHMLLLPYVGSTASVVVILAVLRNVPLLGRLLSVPFGAIASVLWILVAKPLGARVPAGIERIGK